MKDQNLLQAIVDGMSKRMQIQRASTQMTLGKMIQCLSDMPYETMVDGFGNPHSYRGYYEDLAFKPVDNKINCRDALAICQSAMGKVFIGYEGGEFMMGELTPVWLSNYGTTGRKIVAIYEDGKIDTQEDD